MKCFVNVSRSFSFVLHVSVLELVSCSRFLDNFSVYLVLGSCFILQLLLFDEIGVDPDVGQTDGGVETEEDDKRNADVRDDVPGQHAVVFRMQLDGFGFLHLERVDDPQ